MLSSFGGKALPMMAQLAEAGKLTLADVRELEKNIREIDEKRRFAGEGRQDGKENGE
jgi:hypothetical protein